MLIVSDMSSGKTIHYSAAQDLAPFDAVYGDEVLHAAWVDVPQVETRLEEVTMSAGRSSEPAFDARGFMATLYAAQE